MEYRIFHGFITQETEKANLTFITKYKTENLINPVEKWIPKSWIDEAYITVLTKFEDYDFKSFYLKPWAVKLFQSKLDEKDRENELHTTNLPDINIIKILELQQQKDEIKDRIKSLDEIVKNIEENLRVELEPVLEETSNREQTSRYLYKSPSGPILKIASIYSSFYKLKSKSTLIREYGEGVLEEEKVTRVYPRIIIEDS